MNKVVHGHNVKVPVMVNLKDIDPLVELTWGKGAAKGFLASRAAVATSEPHAAVKRMGISWEHGGGLQPIDMYSAAPI